MQRQEIRSLADLAGEGSRTLTTLVRDMHSGIARRVFEAMGPAAFPKATGRIVVFVHGWCLTERSWWRRPRDGESVRPYGTRLRGDLGFTPVYLRYNTGQHISDNGKALAVLMNQLRTLWPVPVEEIALGSFDGRPGGAQRLPLRVSPRARLARRRSPHRLPGLPAVGSRRRLSLRRHHRGAAAGGGHPR